MHVGCQKAIKTGLRSACALTRYARCSAIQSEEKRGDIDAADCAIRPGHCRRLYVGRKDPKSGNKMLATRPITPPHAGEHSSTRQQPSGVGNNTSSTPPATQFHPPAAA